MPFFDFLCTFPNNLLSNAMPNTPNTNTTILYRIATNSYGLLGVLIATGIFMLLLLWPLYKLARTRIALLIMLSKALASVWLIAVTIGNIVLMSLLGLNVSWWIWVQRASTIPGISARVHMLVMALNRAHSVFFPFHYTRKIKKKTTLKVCCLLWLLSLLVVVDQQFTKFLPKDLTMIDNIVCNYGTLLFYALMSGRLFWLKYHLKHTLTPPPALNAENDNGNNKNEKKTKNKKTSTKNNNNGTGAVVEKDHVRICIACMASICPFVLSLSTSLIGMLISPDDQQGGNWAADALLFVMVYGNIIAYMSEEICLLCVCADFREGFLAFLGINKWSKGGGGGGRSTLMNTTNNNAGGTSIFIPVRHNQQLPYRDHPNWIGQQKMDKRRQMMMSNTMTNKNYSSSGLFMTINSMGPTPTKTIKADSNSCA